MGENKSEKSEEIDKCSDIKEIDSDKKDSALDKIDPGKSDKEEIDLKGKESSDKTETEAKETSDPKRVEKEVDETSEDEEQVESKLKAEALSASLSSSRCLLKRNRDDLDTDSDKDSQDEEPDCKKSHKTITDKGDDVKEEETKEAVEDKESKEEEVKKASPVVVEKSKLSKEELIASMSSSKSVLKRGIDQVDESDNDNIDNIVPSDVKKSNIVIDKEHIEEDERTKKVEKNVENQKKESIDIPPVSSTPLSTITHRSPIRPLLLSPPSSSTSLSSCPVLESTRLSPAKSPSSHPEKKEVSSVKSPKSPKEEVRIIAAKDLAEDRKLEKKRLNKLLSIFDDQKTSS